MEMLKELVRNIVVIVIIGAIIDLLMPSGKMQRYLKLVVGLFIIAAILNPLLKISKNPDLGNIINVEASGGEEENLTALMEKGRQLNVKNYQKGLDEYEQRVEQQIVALAELDKEVKVLKASVLVNRDNTAKNFGQVKEVNIMAAKSGKGGADRESIVSPVEIDADSGQKKTEESLSPMAREKIIKTISSFYGLNQEQIKVQNP